jgi:hypothetical protein
MEASESGAKYHAVAEEGVEMRVIAGVISRILSVPMKSLTAEEARDHFGPLSMFVSEDMPASAIATRKKMRWHPTGPTLITDLETIAGIVRTGPQREALGHDNEEQWSR